MLSQQKFGSSYIKDRYIEKCLKFSKSCQIFGGEGPKIRVIWEN